ncbi:FAD binding domain-containing protein [Salisediminibacterium selenitireducens]|uniref:Molybdopterin dehydrogenase FAD-binding protein n=1 Tax=Bacillus selenitireducens (strain ATCC 700615 / DSM 15326 / MLS10) TaxID=439292 RepID=D6XY38_BACIE|nr:FAD binding domain-containing protein [Salisediminibacterium selenitireducens]ADH98111.1 molybdopterin dehydrogenase FAD-binding protein [[Bacillus] selenitireducens MLS10]
MDQLYIHTPDTLSEAWALKTKDPTDSLWLSGTTWLRTQWEAGQLKTQKQWIRLDGIPELTSGIRRDESTLRIAALTTFGEISRCGDTAAFAPLLKQAIHEIAAPSIREQATIGGNVATGSGDSIPALLASGASVLVYTEGRDEEWLLEDWLAAGMSGIIVDIAIPVHKESEDLNVYVKTGRREAFIPSAATFAIKGSWDSDTKTFRTCRAAAGGGTMVPVRLKRLERFLKETPLTSNAVFKKMADEVKKDYRPEDDPFLSGAYKQQIVCNQIIQNIHSNIRR